MDQKAAELSEKGRRGALIVLESDDGPTTLEVGYFETLGDFRRATAGLPDETSMGTRDEQPGFFLDFDPDVLIRGKEPGKFKNGFGLIIVQTPSEGMSLGVAEAVLEDVGYAT